MKMAIDVDGVLLDFMPAFDKAAKIVLGHDIVINKDEYEMDYYHLGKRVGTTQEKVLEILDYMLENRIYANLKAFPGVKESLKAIKEAGYEIYIVTALPELAKEMRLTNLLNELDFEPVDAYFVGMGKSKKQAIQELQPDVFIDDRITYLADAEGTYHLAWVDQKEAQDDIFTLIDVHVHSLQEWVEKHMPRVTKKLDRMYNQKTPVQMELKLESVKRKYNR